MALNNDELLEYLMAYIENEMAQCENEHERIFNAGEFEGILLMLDIFGLDKISKKEKLSGPKKTRKGSK